MTYSTTLTSKGQMTVPAAFRKKLGLKPGEQVLVEMRGNEVVIQKNNWLENLRRVQEENRSYMKKRGIKPLTDEELDNAINSAAEQAAVERYQRSLE
jgi:AbrB family looped-hinge helix DNA binding protein